MNARVFAGLCVALLFGACRRPTALECFESLCFDIAQPHRAESHGSKHVIRFDAPGWIAVQSFAAFPHPEPTLDSADRFMRVRYRRLGATFRSMQREELAGEPALRFDLDFSWQGAAFRRVVWVQLRGRQWLSVDVTARADQFESAQQRLAPLVRHATRRRP